MALQDRPAGPDYAAGLRDLLRRRAVPIRPTAARAPAARRVPRHRRGHQLQAARPKDDGIPLGGPLPLRGCRNRESPRTRSGLLREAWRRRSGCQADRASLQVAGLPARGVPRRPRGHSPAQADHRHVLARAVTGGVLLRPLARADRPVHLRAGPRCSGRGSSAGGRSHRRSGHARFPGHRLQARGRAIPSCGARPVRSGARLMTWAELKPRAVTLWRTPRLLLAQKVLRRVPLRPVDVGRLCFLQLNGVPKVPTAMLRGHAEVRFASADDLDALAQLQDKKALFRTRFAEGDRCIVALMDGRVVGYEWFSDSAVHHETAWGYRITIPGGYIYAYDAYIDPAHRNTGVWLRFKAYLAEWMDDCGKR